MNHFNGFSRNCADFSKHIINTYFPHATHRDFINDFGITSPKAVARTLARYAHHHPELQYRVVHSLNRLHERQHSECRSGTEQLYHSKKLLVPMAFFAWHALPAVAGSYLLTGRFNPQHEFEQHASVRETSTEDELKTAESDRRQDRRSEAQGGERAGTRGGKRATPKEWAAYREEFNSIVSEAVRDDLIPERDSLDHVFKELNARGKPFVDERGGLWLEVERGGETVKIGLSPNNVLAPGSDRPLAYQMILAHVDDMLKSSPRRREEIPQFQQTWGLTPTGPRATTKREEPYAGDEAVACRSQPED